VGTTKKPPGPVKSASDLFDDDDEGDLFKEKPAILPGAASTTKEVESEKQTAIAKKVMEYEEVVWLRQIRKKILGLRSSFHKNEKSLKFIAGKKLDLFGVVPAKKQQEKPLEEKAKQSEPHKKASSLLFSSDEEEHWNVSKPLKLPSEDNRKEDPAKSPRTIGQAKAVKKTSLFEEDDEEDLFAITKESQRKPQRISLLFEDDAVTGESLFSSQSTLPSAASAEKIKPAQAPPLFNEEEKEEKGDRPHMAKSNQAEDTLWSSEEPEAVPVPRGTDVERQVTKEKPSAATSLESDLFAVSPPALEKDASVQARKALSLFDEEEEERLENDGIKNAHKGNDVKGFVCLFLHFLSLILNCNLLENALSAKQHEALKTVTTEASTESLCLGLSKLMPGFIGLFLFPFNITLSDFILFLQTRIKVTGKRRPPSRMARRLAAQESGESGEVDSAKEPQFSVPKQGSALENVKELVVTEAESKENGFLSGSSLPAHGSILTNKLPPESTDQGDDLFESEDLFASRSTSRTATQSKLREEVPGSVANEPVKGMEKKPELSVLGNQDSSDLFQSVQQKSSSKNNPISFLEEEEDSLFTSQKTGKKELKSAVRQAVDSAAQDIFEDDIFATEAIKPMNKAKEKMPETNLFDDNIDIFADLTVKPKEKKTKRKVEQKSIFDDDMASSRYPLPKADLPRQPWR
uniref:FAM21/CAPZIP domain-containing protein n=1 Tax=Pavo cristatus TaxID=9049 RepID=A0A8C9EIN1_PAVCR